MWPQAIGTWKSYLAYSQIQEIERGQNTMFVLASGNLYSYNENDQSITTYDKINGLSDNGIAHIAWCRGARRLVIVYQNQNIDLLDASGNIVNMPDLYNYAITQDKTVFSIDTDGSYAYLSTGFGIVKINVAQAEVSDTYNLGFRVDYSYVSNNQLFAASSTNALYSGPVNGNLADKNNWTRSGNYVARTKTIDPQLLARAQTLSPGGPKYNYFGAMKFKHGRLYTSGGGYYVTSDLNREGCVQVLEGDTWTIYEDSINKKTGIVYIDLDCVDADPRDPNHVFAGGRTGLYEFQDGRFVKLWNSQNSPLESAIDNGNQNYVLVLGLGYDREGNLWVVNSQAPNSSLLEYTASGEWVSHRKEALMRLNGRSLGKLGNVFEDSRNLIWFCNDHFTVPSFYAYQPSSDAMNAYTSFVNEDGTTVTVASVQCIAEDKEGNIWIGSSRGPLMLEVDQITNENYIFNQVKVPRNDGTNLADYLLSGVNIATIVVDKAGRKWFGTKGNGVYLIGADNITQIAHFTTDNSGLLSNSIESMAINDATGEVYIGTDAGLCSYMSDASAINEKMTKDNVYAYPNPVRPDYTGPITIVGLSYDADVKIVTVNGTLVNEGRSNGGTYVWNGLDTRGKRVASGVYMVQTATQSGSKGTVCKVAIVN